MKRLAVAARAFADNPPRQVRFVPAPYKIIQEHRRLRYDEYEYLTADGTPFDDMEIGDTVVLCFKHTAHYQKGSPTVSESWHPATCRSAAKERSFQDNNRYWKEQERGRGFDVWRVTYRNRQAVHKLLDRDFESRAALESAIAAANYCDAETEFAEAAE